MIKWFFIFGTMLILCGTFVAWEMNWLKPAVVPPREQVVQAADYCAQLAGYDDGASDDERLAMAVATMNRAKASGQSTCDVYKNFGSLIGPGTKTWFPWFRETPVMNAVAQLSADRLAGFNQTGLLLEKYQKDPAEDLKKFPWLSCVEYYIRSTWKGATPYPDVSLREKARQVWVSPVENSGEHAELFCPKK